MTDTNTTITNYFHKEGLIQMTIHYPKDFKNRVLEIYPNMSPAFRSALMNNEEILGRFLDDNVNSISAQTILHHITMGSIDKLKSMAALEIAKQKLYSEWYDIATAARNKADYRA